MLAHQRGGSVNDGRVLPRPCLTQAPGRCKASKPIWPSRAVSKRPAQKHVATPQSHQLVQLNAWLLSRVTEEYVSAGQGVEAWVVWLKYEPGGSDPGTMQLAAPVALLVERPEGLGRGAARGLEVVGFVGGGPAGVSKVLHACWRRGRGTFVSQPGLPESARLHVQMSVRSQWH
jgi:hypothetical protein